MKKFACLLCLFLYACCSGGPVLDVCAFYDIPVGATPEELVAIAGRPVTIRRYPDGSIEYEYLERFKVGARVLNERHYFVLIQDGKVVSKRVTEVSPTPFGYDSYDMQTTQKEDSN